MKHVHTNQTGFWDKVNGEYLEVQVSVKSSPSSRTRLIGIDCTITVGGESMKHPTVTTPLSQAWKKGDLFVGLRGINGGFSEGEIYKIIDEVEEDNMPACIKADGSGMSMYILTKYMGVVSQQDRLQVGDRVEIIDTEPYNWSYDMFGTVIRIGSFITVGLEKRGVPYMPYRDRQYSLTFDRDQLKKVTTPKPKYKEGDVLMFTGKTKHVVGFDAGVEVTLGVLHNEGVPDREWGYVYLCSEGGYGYSQWIPEEALEPIKPTPKEAVDGITEIKVDDKVMVTAEDMGHCHEDLSHGDIITVTKVMAGLVYYWHEEHDMEYCLYRADVKKVITPMKTPCSCNMCKDGVNISSTCGVSECSICAHRETHYYRSERVPF